MTAPRLACTISVGDELLAGESLDTHGRTIATALGLRGTRVVGHRVVGDDQRAITEAIERARAESDLVFVTGGLGPTLDDVTREALAAAVEEPLVEDAEALRTIEAWFAGRSRPMPAANRRQAMRPVSAEMIPNEHGTAPGVFLSTPEACVVLLPGPPRELRPMLDRVLARLYPDASPRPALVVRAHGIGESDAAARIEALMRRDATLPVATTVSDSIVSARIRGRDAGDAEAVERLGREVESSWSPFAFGRGDTTLEDVVGGLLVERGLSVSTAESCTGGLIGAALTAVPGSSAWYPGGVVVYANERKVEDLGVDPGRLKRDGAVDREVAASMADGVRRRSGTDIGVATTGIAGPSGGSERKPVGTVWIAVADDRGVDVRRFRFPGGRPLVRRRTVLAALQRLRLRMLDEEDALLWEWPAP